MDITDEPKYFDLNTFTKDELVRKLYFCNTGFEKLQQDNKTLQKNNRIFKKQIVTLKEELQKKTELNDSLVKQNSSLDEQNIKLKQDLRREEAINEGILLENATLDEQNTKLKEQPKNIDLQKLIESDEEYIKINRKLELCANAFRKCQKELNERKQLVTGSKINQEIIDSISSIDSCKTMLLEETGLRKINAESINLLIKTNGKLRNKYNASVVAMEQLKYDNSTTMKEIEKLCDDLLKK